MSAPGRNDPCPCGSGRKFKQCCLLVWAREDAERLRVRRAEGRVVDALLAYVLRTWGEPFLHVAWAEFFLWDDVPPDMLKTPEFDTMFIPWLTLAYAPDPRARSTVAGWPIEPVGRHWLAAEQPDLSDDEREFVRVACDSPMSAFVVEAVVPERSVDLKDILTGRRFHVLEQSATRTLRPNDLAFTRVVTLKGTSVMFGMAPWVIPARWHTNIIDWRESRIRRRLMTRPELTENEIEIRELYLDIAERVRNPAPPRLNNTDGDPIELTTLTFEVESGLEETIERLAPLARPGTGEADPIADETRDAAGALTGATMSWQKAGNKMHKSWSNTILGTFRLSPGRVVAEVNSARRASKLKREIARIFGTRARLADVLVTDVAKAMAERAVARAAGGLQDDAEIDEAPELREASDEFFRRHLEEWINMKIPALGHRTPRQAARSASGRERLSALLSSFDDGREKLSPVRRQHLADLRKRLGL